MPTISMFYGIIIKMYWNETGRHKMPHVHAYYGGKEAVFSFNGDIIAGEFPGKQAAYVKAWILLHEEDLKANWQLAADGEELYRIEPLK